MSMPPGTMSMARLTAPVAIASVVGHAMRDATVLRPTSGSRPTCTSYYTGGGSNSTALITKEGVLVERYAAEVSRPLEALVPAQRKRGTDAPIRLPEINGQDHSDH